jgi:hypothetical protein
MCLEETTVHARKKKIKVFDKEVFWVFGGGRGGGRPDDRVSICPNADFLDFFRKPPKSQKNRFFWPKSRFRGGGTPESGFWQKFWEFLSNEKTGSPDQGFWEFHGIPEIPDSGIGVDLETFGYPRSGSDGILNFLEIPDLGFRKFWKSHRGPQNFFGDHGLCRKLCKKVFRLNKFPKILLVKKFLI